MKKRYIMINGLILFLIIIIVSSTLSSISVNAVNINKCDLLEIAGERYNLTSSVRTSDSTCFTIVAPNIVLNCNNFSIITNNISADSIYYNKKNITIIDCNNKKQLNNTIANTIAINNQKSSTDVNSKLLVDSKKALFDIIIDIVSEPKISGEDLVIKIALINFGSSKKVDANLEYQIIDNEGKIIKQYFKSVPVVTQIEFLDYINTKGIANGRYNLKIKLAYEGQTFPASTEKIFDIGAVNKIFRDINVKTTILPVIIALLLFGVYVKNRRNKIREEENINNNNNIDITKDITKYYIKNKKYYKYNNVDNKDNPNTLLNNHDINNNNNNNNNKDDNKNT
jgi:hypothetical protein